nr:hypothetical protein [Tanacetum cinerariifolium]
MGFFKIAKVAMGGERFIEDVIMKKFEYFLFDVVVEFHRVMLLCSVSHIVEDFFKRLRSTLEEEGNHYMEPTEFEIQKMFIFLMLRFIFRIMLHGRRPIFDDYKKGKKINDLQLIMCGDMFKKITSQGEALKRKRMRQNTDPPADQEAAFLEDCSVCGDLLSRTGSVSKDVRSLAWIEFASSYTWSATVDFVLRRIEAKAHVDEEICSSRKECWQN